MEIGVVESLAIIDIFKMPPGIAWIQELCRKRSPTLTTDIGSVSIIFGNIYLFPINKMTRIEV